MARWNVARFGGACDALRTGWRNGLLGTPEREPEEIHEPRGIEMGM